MRPTELTDFVVSLVSCGAFVALTLLAASRGKRDPLARLLALLCVNLVLYSSSEAIGVLGTHRSQPMWDWINNVTASESPPLFYHLVVAFVGQRKALQKAIIACHLYFGVLAILCATPFVIPSMAWFPGGVLWAIFMLVGMVTIMVHGVVMLTRHVNGASMEEKARARLILASVLVAGIGNMTDLADIAGAVWAPRLGMSSLVVCAFVLTVAALRVHVFERLSFLTAVNAVTIALCVVLAEISVFRFVGDRSALAVVLTVFVVLCALISSRFVVGDYAAARERTLAHASLGRMAAQMAHDIKNPLAAIRGAAQYLAAERTAGRSIDEQNEFLDLLVAQSDRLTRIVDQYHRIGRGEPVLGKTDINDAAREAMKFLSTSTTIDAKLTEPLPACETDRDLIVIALENVLRNAHEAAIDRTVHVETGHNKVGGNVFVAVRDEGPGMDPRTRERALEGFFTTKSQGSGLGLAFVRRVVEAHRGKLLIESQEGQGTTVRIELRAAS